MKDGSGYPLPEIIDPPERLCVQIFIPNEPTHRQVFVGLIYSLTRWYNWQRDSLKRGKDVAAVWMTVYQAMVNTLYDGCEAMPFDVRQNGGNPCTLEKTEDGTNWTPFADLRLCPPLLRRNPETGDLEYSPDDGVTWTPYPRSPVPPRPENNDDEARCLAAANAVNVLVALHQQTVTLLQQGINNPLVIGVSLALFLAALLVFAPAAALIGSIIGGAVILLYGLSLNDFTEQIQDDLRCIFYCASTRGESGVVSFDFGSVQSEVQANAGIGDMWRALDYYLSIIQADGLNRAGATTAIQTADCATCDCDPGWCVTYNFTLSDGGWVRFNTLNRGVYVPGEGWRGTTGSGATERIIIDLALDPGTFVTEFTADVDNRALANNHTELWDLPDILQFTSTPINGSFTWTGDRQMNTVRVDLEAQTGAYALIRAVTLKGYGERPPGGADC